jgi:hypothetical protein
MEQTNIQFSTDDYKAVAIKVQERVQKELPIMQEVLDALEKGAGIQLLPQAIHTIAVVCHNKSYKLLNGAFDIYSDMIERGKPDGIEAINHDLWKSIKKSHSVITKLYNQETYEFERQTLMYREEIKKMKAEDPSIDEGAMLEQEKAYFQHVECDISSAIKSYIFMLIVGYEPSDKQTQAMENMLAICKDILREGIAQHERTLETTTHILS